MNQVRVVAAQQSTQPDTGITISRLRTIVQDSHLNFLIGAGTPSAFFGQLGNIEEALTKLSEADAPTAEKDLVRASIQAHFFEKVLEPNLALTRGDRSAEGVLTSYERFLRTLNRILLKRRSSLLGKQANIFTTNIDMVFEVALENLGVDMIDGFNGKMRPKFDLGEYGTVRLRQASRYERRSEIPVLNLYKIHGSAGWTLYSDGPDKSSIYFDHGLSGVVDTAGKLSVATPDLLPIEREVIVDDLLAAAFGKELSAEATAFADAYARLPIVNPEKTKFAATVLNETYYELIRRFANELEKENSVLFVHGFSFRDEHICDMVIRAARANPTLQVIVFSYSRGAKSDYKDLLPDREIKNGNVIFVTPPEPTGEDGNGVPSEDVLNLDRVDALYFSPLVPEESRKPDHILEVQVNDGSDGTTDV
ncbi:hypothetical protein ACH436_00570 [Isoptericola sp. NPDC019693]|uniref:hypothetical protein n=1 Tax=Isoptericola sp. NPDC019693 TaxID=3364009 RepID=UPI00379C9F8F